MTRAQTAISRGTMALASILWMAVMPVAAEETLTRIVWDPSSIPIGETVEIAVGEAPDGSRTLRVRAEAPQAVSLPLWRFDQPPVTTSAYALVGRVRHHGVEEDAYLEMWSHFSDGGAFFSRTLAVTGPMRSLRGDSPWRDLLLPFDLGESALTPTLLELNLHLPASGEVEIGSLSLVQYLPGENPLVGSDGRADGTARAWALGTAIALFTAAALLAAVLVKRRRSTVSSELRKIEALDAP